ncbi:MAG: FkbM family methyltransferase [Lachnospiraceae bacterium]|jgi:FkbM family methyltransferase|nr:FkbM family methyltransferase [Lachnospiraceae bacterium]
MKKIVINVIMYLPRRIRKFIIGNIERELKTVLESTLLFQQMILSQPISLEFQDIKFRGQIRQDLYAFVFFNGKRDGFFIDIGAHDGICFNNTYFFEQIGWKGICIEPQADIYEILKKNRNCDVYNVAIGNETKDDVDFVKVHGVDMLSGLNSEMTKVHKERIEREKGRIELIKIETLSFNDLMKNYPNKTYIDFLSIDVEGAEMSILKSIDFSKYSFGLLTVENNKERKNNDREMKKYMSVQGYEVLHDLGLDIMFMKSNYT